MNISPTGLIKSGYAPSDEDNVVVFHGIVTELPSYWVFRFADGPITGDHGPFPMEPPEQFDFCHNAEDQWVFTPCSRGLAPPREVGHWRYERTSMSSLSDVDAEARRVIRGARYRLIG